MARLAVEEARPEHGGFLMPSFEKPITVARLMAELELLPPEALVLLSSDSEGNDINYLYEVDTSRYQDYGPGGGIDLIHPEDDDEEDPDIKTGVVLGP